MMAQTLILEHGRQRQAYIYEFKAFLDNILISFFLSSFFIYFRKALSMLKKLVKKNGVLQPVTPKSYNYQYVPPCLFNKYTLTHNTQRKLYSQVF